MKKIAFYLLLLLSITIYSQEVLTNQSIIELVELGFGSDIIISKIKASDVKFDTSLKELKILKKNNVPNDVLALMMSKSKTKIKTGIYFYLTGGKLKKLEPTIFSGTRSSGGLASALTYGIASSKTKSYLPNKFSSNIVEIDNQHFIFQFAEQEESTNKFNNLNNMSWRFSTVSSPNQFILIKLKQNKRKNSRELLTGKHSILEGHQIGISTKNAILLNIEKISKNKFKVSPRRQLEVGEYCFFYQGTLPTGYSNQSVFDFSIVR